MCSFPDPRRGSLNGSAAGDDGVDPRLRQRGLCRSEARERHAVGRAADVVEPEPVAERDRLRLAAVLAADAELEVLLDAAPALDGDAHQVADAVLVEELERVALEHAVLEVARQELALGVVAREAERRLRQVVGATDSGSPPCSPQMPSLRSSLTLRPRSTAMRISSPTPSWSRNSNGLRSRTPSSR